MRWRNTETPTFIGSDGTKITGPDVVETMELLDRDGNSVLAFTKAVDGSFSGNQFAATATEVNQFNDVSAYQETIAAAGALSVLKKHSRLALAGAGAVTLAAPDASMLGQIKVIEMTTDNGDVTLALTNVQGGSAATTATFSAVTQMLVLIAGVSKWTVLKEFGVVLS